MFFSSMIVSPLEQFEILPYYSFSFGGVDLSITNQTFLLFFSFSLIVIMFFNTLNLKTFTLKIIPHGLQIIFEAIYSLVLNIVVDNINGERNQKFFPLIFSLFFFIAVLNLIGLVPYSFTVTSHFIVTVVLSLTIFIGINIICAQVHGLAFFSLFLPSGTPILLAFLLVPVEFILYLFRPFSLAIRLFCNMMAGHTLLKIFAGFAWSLMSFSGILFFVQYIPLFTLLPLFGLELGVALIQAFVFSLLTSIYLNDALNLH